MYTGQRALPYETSGDGGLDGDQEVVSVVAVGPEVGVAEPL